jgi:hypothetical protein
MKREAAHTELADNGAGNDDLQIADHGTSCKPAGLGTHPTVPELPGGRGYREKGPLDALRLQTSLQG